MNKINYNPDVLTCLANLSNDEVFTPPQLVNEMLDMLPQEIWSNKDAKFLDPFSKTGVFLREITSRLVNGLEKEIPDLQTRVDHILKNQVYGIAITELTALLSRRGLYCSKIANGKYSICNSLRDKSGNIIFENIEHTWKGGSCIFCGASKEVYDRNKDLETYAYNFIHTNKPEEVFNMKFDVIIGNPPYQLNDGGNGASATPIYQKFVEQAKKLNPRYLTMIIPSRWFAGGKGLDNFRTQMLSDQRISHITDYANAKDCFPGISLGGGVCYFLWQKDRKGPCEVTNVLNGEKDIMKRSLNEYPIFVRYNKAISTVRKISKDQKFLSSLVSSRNPFGVSSAARGSKNPFSDSIALYSSEGISYINKLDINQGKEHIYKYKIIISKVTSEHAGEPDKNGQFKVLSSIKILKPGEVCTDSYLRVGSYNNESNAQNLMSYLKTRFTRFLLLQAVTSINLSKEKFAFVPLQDFSKQAKDEDLYKKYSLSDEEVDFVESMIKPMEGENNGK